MFLLGSIAVGAGVFFLYKGAQNKLEESGIDLKKKELKFKGGSVGDDVDKPKDWPDDIPVYEGKIKYASSSKDNLMIGISTDDEQSAIKEYYQDMASDGWKKESETTVSGTYVSNFTKGDRRVTVSITKDPTSQSKNYITIIAAKER